MEVGHGYDLHELIIGLGGQRVIAKEGVRVG